MQTYELLVKERSVLPNSADMTLVRTSIGIDQVHVMFDNSEWLDFPVSITFGNGDTVITQSLTTSALTDIDGWVAEGTCVIPWEVVQDNGAIRVTLQGTDQSGNHIITAYGAPLTVEECGDTLNGDIPSDVPTIDEWNQAYAQAQIAINALQSKLDECDAAIAEMQQYTPTAATSESLGLVQPDNETITVDENGVISSNGYTLPTAASNVLGGVQVSGNTIEIDEFGTIDVTDEIAQAADVVGAAFDTAYEDGELVSATVKPESLPIATDESIGGVIPDGTTVTVDEDGVISANASYELPVADASTLGGIKVGSGLAIDANGVLSVDIPDGDSTSY